MTPVVHKVVGRREILYWEATNKSMCGQPGVVKWHWKYVTCEACLKFRKVKEEWE